MDKEEDALEDEVLGGGTTDETKRFGSDRSSGKQISRLLICAIALLASADEKALESVAANITEHLALRQRGEGGGREEGLD